jgi:hypothetical protein
MIVNLNQLVHAADANTMSLRSQKEQLTVASPEMLLLVYL